MSNHQAGKPTPYSEPIPFRPRSIEAEERQAAARARLDRMILDVRAHAKQPENHDAAADWDAAPETRDDGPATPIPGLAASLARVRARLREVIKTRH